jgi:hypothetical protein
MFAMIPYYRWKEPELSLSEKVWLGKEILKAGPSAFAAAFKKRLFSPAYDQKDKPIAWADVFADARTPPAPITKRRKMGFSGSRVRNGGCMRYSSSCRDFSSRRSSCYASYSGGTYLWASRKVDLLSLSWGPGPAKQRHATCPASVFIVGFTVLQACMCPRAEPCPDTPLVAQDRRSRLPASTTAVRCRSNNKKLPKLYSQG